MHRMLECTPCSMITHAELNALLRRSGATMDAAECHGSLCGTLCTTESGTDAWLETVLEGLDARSVPVADLRAQLSRLTADTRKSLRDGSLAFTPLLPGDDEHLGDRAVALGEWCAGFLSGLGSAGIGDFDKLPPDAQEIVRDVVEIARVGVPTQAGEGDEAAYVELVEYLRVGVQLMHERKHPGPAPAELKAPPGVH